MHARPLVACLFALSFVCTASGQTPGPRPQAGKKTSGAKAAARKVESAPPDVAIETRYTNGAQVSLNKTYFKGARQRFDFPGVSSISQCDRNRTIHINDATHRYLVVGGGAAAASPTARPTSPAAADPMVAMGPRPAAPPGGVITETTTLHDTGERKTMFGLEARRITMVTVRQPDAKACDTEGSRVETDGWFVDLPERAACPALAVPAAPAAPEGQACIDRIEARQVGDARLGFALSTVVTTTAGEDVTTMALEVTDLKVAPLDPARFDIPPGYTEAKTYRDLLPALASGGSLADAVFGSLADGTSTVAPKRPGVIRIGIAEPVDRSGRSLSLAMLRGRLVSSLSKAPFEALPVTGAQLADIDRDAAAKACDFVLVAEIAELRASKPGKVGGMLRRASRDAEAPSEVYDARVDYRLYAVGSPAQPRLASSTKASSGKFGVGSALKVAKFAGSMYLGFTARMMMGGGMMGPYGSLMSGGGGGGGVANGVVNPGLGAAVSMIFQAQTVPGSGLGTPGVGGLGMDDASSQRATETVHQALAKAGDQVAGELRKGKS